MSYFHFSRGKKIGVVVLSSLIVILVVLLNVNNHVVLPNPFGEVVETNYDLQSTDTINNSSFESHVNNKNNFKVESSSFNPNELDKEGWETKGFSSKQATSIVNYHEKFGPFNSAADVEKIYVISEDKFNEIEPFMVFDNSNQAKKEKINVNTANSEELESIHGIGAYYAKKIMDYRDDLGGFLSINQFEEIGDLRDESITALIENVIIDTDRINKIEINSIPKNELKTHPYFKDWAVVTSIIKKRDREKISSLLFLKEEGLVNEKQLMNMQMYVDFN